MKNLKEKLATGGFALGVFALGVGYGVDRASHDNLVEMKGALYQADRIAAIARTKISISLNPKKFDDCLEKDQACVAPNQWVYHERKVLNQNTAWLGKEPVSNWFNSGDKLEAALEIEDCAKRLDRCVDKNEK